MKIRPYEGTKFRADAGVMFGKRTTRVFETKKDAELWLKQQEKVRHETRIGVRRLSADREQLAMMSFERLEKHGLKDDAILDAVRRFCDIASPSQKSTLRNALNKFERDLGFGNRSPIYITQLMSVLNRFYKDFAEKSVHEITGDMVQEWLEENCATSSNRKNRRRDIKVFFSWAVKQNPPLLRSNPVNEIPTITVHGGKPEILTLEQVRAGLNGLQGADRAAFAIMVFTGLRPSEAEALQWEDIKLDRGFLENVHGTGADNRNVELSDNLTAWLRPIAKTSGPVFPGQSRHWRVRVKKPLTAAGCPIKEWAQDILRHTFGSYHVERYQDAAKTAYQMGHKRDPQILFKHYRELVTPEDAIAFWKIKP